MKLISYFKKHPGLTIFGALTLIASTLSTVAYLIASSLVTNHVG